MLSSTRRLNYFSSDGFLTQDVKRGVLTSRGGSRMVAINEDFLRGFVVACEYETGDATPMIVRRCGRFFGERLSRRFDDELGRYAGVAVRDRSMVEFDGLVRDLWSGCGLGKLVVDWERGRQGFLAIELSDSPMQDIGPSGHTADDMFAGILEGFFGGFCDGDMACVQTGDKRLGSKEGTTFVLVAPERVSDVSELVAQEARHSVICEQLAR